jgi:hypothetical protein
MSTQPTFTEALKEPNANVLLYISNQSFEEPLVDIFVSIDDRTIVKDTFKVKNQHYWRIYSLHLSPGKHAIHAKAVNGAVAIDRSFILSGKHWAVLNFWGSKTNADKSELKGITFEVSNEPISFL